MSDKKCVLNFGYFQLARNESLKVNFRSRIGAVLVRSGKPISVGRNHPTKTHPLVRKYHLHKTIHAEFSCVIGINRELVSGSTMYIYRETKDGTLALSKPCKTCMKFLKDIGIRKIYYTTKKGYLKEKI